MSGPAGTRQRIDALQFEIPVGYAAVCVRHINVEAHVRIGPFHLGDDTGHLENLINVILRREGVMAIVLRSDE